jgi:hypothetical protein
MDTCGCISTLTTPSLVRITTSTYLLLDLRQGYFGMLIGHHLQSTPWQLCPHSPTAPLPDFQSLSPEQKEEIYQHIEEKLKPSSVNRTVHCHHYTFAHKALACGATGPDLQPHRDISYKVFG